MTMAVEIAKDALGKAKGESATNLHVYLCDRQIKRYRVFCNNSATVRFDIRGLGRVVLYRCPKHAAQLRARLANHHTEFREAPCA